jgi:DNA-binding NarL/FixJ family response regulator
MSMPQQVSVVVVTEDRVTGEALACACRRHGVTATVCEPHRAPSATGDVVILDLTTPQPSGSAWPVLSGAAVRTVAVGGSPSALPAGAVVDRWVPDDRSLDDLLDAVTSAVSNVATIAAPSAMTSNGNSAATPNGTSTTSRPSDVGRTRRPVGSLTSREREVLAALLAADGVPGIARRLQITENTVRTHLQNVFAKLGVNSRAEAAAYALRHGLVDDVRRASA